MNIQKSIRASLIKTNTLWILFVTTLLLFFTFRIVASQWGFTFIDSISSPASVGCAKWVYLAHHCNATPVNRL